MPQDLFGSASVEKCLKGFFGRLLTVEARVGEEGLTRGQLRESEVAFGLSQPPASLGACIRLHRCLCRRRERSGGSGCGASFRTPPECRRGCPSRPWARAPHKNGGSARGIVPLCR